MRLMINPGVTMITISTLDMWRTSGFLARVFAPFEELGMSIDLVATSQSAVSMTLDRIPGGIDGSAFVRLIERLEKLGRVEAVHPCGVVSVVGRRIRAALHELGPAMEVFQERPVLLVSDSSEDLNLSFVVDEPHTAALTVRLHDRLFPAHGGDPRLGSTWEVLEGKKSQEGGGATRATRCSPSSPTASPATSTTSPPSNAKQTAFARCNRWDRSIIR